MILQRKYQQNSLLFNNLLIAFYAFRTAQIGHLSDGVIQTFLVYPRYGIFIDSWQEEVIIMKIIVSTHITVWKLRNFAHTQFIFSYQDACFSSGWCGLVASKTFLLVLSVRFKNVTFISCRLTMVPSTKHPITNWSIKKRLALFEEVTFLAWPSSAKTEVRLISFVPSVKFKNVTFNLFSL